MYIWGHCWSPQPSSSQSPAAQTSTLSESEWLKQNKLCFFIRGPRLHSMRCSHYFDSLNQTNIRTSLIYRPPQNTGQQCKRPPFLAKAGAGARSSWCRCVNIRHGSLVLHHITYSSASSPQQCHQLWSPETIINIKIRWNVVWQNDCWTTGSCHNQSVKYLPPSMIVFHKIQKMRWSHAQNYTPLLSAPFFLRHDHKRTVNRTRSTSQVFLNLIGQSTGCSRNRQHQHVL